MEFKCEGTLGDSYIVTCKLSKLKHEKLKIYHYTECEYWKNEIRDIYSLLPNVIVKFVEDQNKNLQLISSLPKLDDMCYFPEFDSLENDSRYIFEGDYLIVQANSGKPVDAPPSVNNTKNTKLLSEEIIEALIHNNADKTVVLIGTEDNYKDIKNCINLVGKLTIKEAIYAVQKCKAFVGPEGLLSFVSLSHKNSTIILFSDEHWIAIGYRIVDTPWEEYVKFNRVSQFGIRELYIN